MIEVLLLTDKTPTMFDSAGPSVDLVAATELDGKHSPVTDAPYVSVVIPHYNDLEALSVCIASLRLQSWPAERMEVIVADNNSACGVEAVRRAAAGCRVVQA